MPAKAHALPTAHSGEPSKEAARYYLKHVITCRNAPTISQIVERMIAEAEKNDRRDRRLSELTIEEIKAWVD